MKVALLVPCYMDLFFADAAMATVRLLERLGVDVDYPDNQTCCGQPMANTGRTKDAKPVVEHFVKTFSAYDTIVCPSGSCASMVRHHYHGLVADSPESQKVCNNTWELSEFLLDVLKISDLDVSFPHKVGIHQACHGLRELRLGPCSERRTDEVSKMRVLLEMVKRLVKSKSMLTEECHLNPHLESLGMEVIDTDLGERIVQLREEPPSHIVMPAIHLKKGEIGELFHKHLGTEAGNEDPQYLTEAARQHLREKFIQADAGITGVNFAIAETGGVVVCTNEGNCDLGTSLPKVHIACMGMEKLIPRLKDLGTFTRLLARSHRPAHYNVYLAFPRAQRRWRNARGHSRQRPVVAVGRRTLPPLAALHPMRGLHEYLPGVPALRWAQLRHHRSRAHRFHAVPTSGY